MTFHPVLSIDEVLELALEPGGRGRAARRLSAPRGGHGGRGARLGYGAVTAAPFRHLFGATPAPGRAASRSPACLHRATIFRYTF